MILQTEVPSRTDI